MKLQELLQSVDFKKVALAFERMYPDDKHMLSFLKCHYDILCHITPAYDENVNSQECRISYIYDEIVNRSYLSAFPLEGDKWSASLYKEIIIDCDVNVTKEEIVACCLWHTSFWGYTEEQLSETAKDFNIYRDKTGLEISEYKLNINIAELKRIGCKNISLPRYQEVKGIVKMRANREYNKWKQKHIDKRLRNRLFRKEFLKTAYYDYLNSIVRFIMNIYGSNEEISETLCKLFNLKRFAAYSFKSYTYGKTDSIKYLKELLFDYKGIDNEYIFSNVIICIVKPTTNINPTTEEIGLCKAIYSLCPKGINHTFIKSDMGLKDESKIYAGFYE